jgi:hypothetical protein
MQHVLVVVDPVHGAVARARRHLARCIYDSGAQLADLGDLLVCTDDRGIGLSAYLIVADLHLDGAAPAPRMPGLDGGETPEEVWAISTDPDLVARVRTWATWVGAEFTHAHAVRGAVPGDSYTAGPPASEWRTTDPRLH